MSRTEQDQEYVLGTKQLLSAFFVVVALLGVFFTAGYIIGRNTGASARSGTSDTANNVSPAPETAQRSVARSEPPPTIEPAPTPVSKSPEATPVTTSPVKTASVAEAESKPPAIDPKPQPVQPEIVGAVASQVVPGHMYLQLMAVKRPVADNMVKLLKGRGYPALLGESSKPELFRVLVGPFTDMASLAKTKSGLKSAGFESVIAK